MTNPLENHSHLIMNNIFKRLTRTNAEMIVYFFKLHSPCVSHIFSMVSDSGD